MDVADEHSRVTDDVLLHEVDGVVNLARSAQRLNTSSIMANNKANGILRDHVFSSLFRSNSWSFAADRQRKHNGWKSLRKLCSSLLRNWGLSRQWQLRMDVQQPRMNPTQRRFRLFVLQSRMRHQWTDLLNLGLGLGMGLGLSTSMSECLSLCLSVNGQ